MRLNCPNCDAQYEVPADVVPLAGRDVQCSNCGKTWFQHHPDHEPAEDGDHDRDLSGVAPAPDDEISPTEATPADSGIQPRELDPAIANILREEAENELEARKQRQSGSLESQPDLGLTEAEQSKPSAQPLSAEEKKRAAEAQDRMAKMRGEPETKSVAAATAAAMSSRRELLPDIDEINSTLRNDSSGHGVDAETREEIGAGGQRKRKRGFRKGFFTMLLIFAVMALIYVFAPKISNTLPTLEPSLMSYVEWVDGLRATWGAKVREMLGSLDNFANETSP